MREEPIESELGKDAAVPVLVHHMKLPHTRISAGIDRMLRAIGDLTSWIWAVLLGVIILNVLMRYVLGQGRIEFEELQWHLYSVGIMLGLAYVFESDDHIRVDVLHERFSLRAKCWVELYGILLLLLPFIALVVVYAVPFVMDAYATGERSASPGGLGYRWIIKSFLLIGFALLALAAFARLTRVCSLLFGAPRAVASPTPATPEET